MMDTNVYHHILVSHDTVLHHRSGRTRSRVSTFSVLTLFRLPQPLPRAINGISVPWVGERSWHTSSFALHRAPRPLRCGSRVKCMQTQSKFVPEYEPSQGGEDVTDRPAVTLSRLVPSKTFHRVVGIESFRQRSFLFSTVSRLSPLACSLAFAVFVRLSSYRTRRTYTVVC